MMNHPCLIPGKNPAASVATGSVPIHEQEPGNGRAAKRSAGHRCGRRAKPFGVAGTRVMPSPTGSINGRHKPNRRLKCCGYPPP
jgi:hypothetical protein